MNHLATEGKLEILINTNTYTQIIIIIIKRNSTKSNNTSYNVKFMMFLFICRKKERIYLFIYFFLDYETNVARP